MNPTQFFSLLEQIKMDVDCAQNVTILLKILSTTNACQLSVSHKSMTLVVSTFNTRGN